MAQTKTNRSAMVDANGNGFVADLGGAAPEGLLTGAELFAHPETTKQGQKVACFTADGLAFSVTVPGKPDDDSDAGFQAYAGKLSLKWSMPAGRKYVPLDSDKPKHERTKTGVTPGRIIVPHFAGTVRPV